MMDGRRHSVDIPISKAIVALRRVRSLRDPSTNSMSKFSALIDNPNWDTNSCNGISLRFENDLHEPGLGTCQEGDEAKKDSECDGSRKSKSKSSSGKQEIKRSKLRRERYNGLDLAYISPSNHHLEGSDSNNAQDGQFPSLGPKKHDKAKNRIRHRSYMRSPMSVGDIASCVGSGTLLEGSISSTSLFENDEADVAEGNYVGCGIRCCWSRTPRYRDLVSDGEDFPLISAESGEADMSGQSKSWNRVSNEIVPYSESPRSLSQKFRPKAFSDLVGQSVTSRSILGAISNGRITSMYLFYGPRGTGKTSASKVFAAALNCLSVEEQKPCGMCQECILYFAGQSRDVKEVDSVRINRANRVRSLIKNATLPPVSSKFKVFIVDECQLLRDETWATLLSSIDGLSHHVVFIMITPDLDKLPRSAVARCQRYHFPKIKDADIVSRLRKICVQEGLEFDQVALDFISAKSSGSLRDAEMMLDQLSLLGRKITMSLAYELIGTVSDDELLDLLDLALSADTSSTVKRARELMRSRIDPMQLISQLANVIMDILAGKSQDEASELKMNFLKSHASETDIRKLRHALKILSETEKQLRTSKNQTTWLTVALLQLNSMDSSFSDVNESRLSLRTENSGDGECCSTSSPGQRSNHVVPCDCGDDETRKVRIQEDYGGTLDSIWMRATEICSPNSFKNFLRKRGKLCSVWVKKETDLAIAEVEFCHPDYVSKAEKSWKLIASSLQSVIGSNVEIRINHTPTCTKPRRSSFSLFSCSRRIHNPHSAAESGSDQSDVSNFTSDKAMLGDKHTDMCSSCGSHVTRRKEMVSTIRNTDGNALSTGTMTPQRGSQDRFLNERGVVVVDSSKESDFQPNSYLKSVKMNKKLISSNNSEMVCLEIQPRGYNVSTPREASFDTYICTDYPYILSNGSDNSSNISGHANGQADDGKAHCWRTPPFPIKKAWQEKHQRQRSHLVGWVLPCAAAK